MDRPLEPRPADLSGMHHRQIVVRDFLIGVEHTFDLYISDERRDSYRVVVDGALCLLNRRGWTDAVEMAGKSFVRVWGFA